MHDEEEREERRRRAAVARFALESADTITNALHNHADRMAAAAAEALTGYVAGQASAEARAAQDGSMMTNRGLLLSAGVLAEDAAKALRVARVLRRLADDDEAEPATVEREERDAERAEYVGTMLGGLLGDDCPDPLPADASALVRRMMYGGITLDGLRAKLQGGPAADGEAVSSRG